MGNCQAIDSAAILLQHPNGTTTKVEKLYNPVTAHQVMKLNPGHYVALLLTTTTTMSPATNNNNNIKTPVRVTRIKLLKPTDILVLGHIYRLITTQEVMKGLCAKKYAKMKQKKLESDEKMTQKSTLHTKATTVRRSVQDNSKQVKHEKHRKSVGANSRAWSPSLQSISEAAA